MRGRTICGERPAQRRGSRRETHRLRGRGSRSSPSLRSSTRSEVQAANPRGPSARPSPASLPSDT